MNKHHYHITDEEGYVLLTVCSQITARSYDEEAKFAVVPLLPIVAEQYGLDQVFYSEVA